MNIDAPTSASAQRGCPAWAEAQGQLALRLLLEDFHRGGNGISSEAFREDHGITDIPTRIFELRFEQDPQGWPIVTKMGRARNGFTKVAIYRLTSDRPSTDPKYRFRATQKKMRFKAPAPIESAPPESPYMQRMHQERDRAMPLFAAVRK